MKKEYDWHTERCLMIYELMNAKNSLEFSKILMKYFEGLYDKVKYAKNVLKI
ncbi:hypothetical protein LCGC14_1406290 [marine sediment metagenome]|uniref:Uncharacterized protein n=1 Tax=marine sediment metagenome TaxID=412755 RepID=A0A0F9JVX7_9ZZZZ